jgi:hypothetical protein
MVVCTSGYRMVYGVGARSGAEEGGKYEALGCSEVKIPLWTRWDVLD